MNCAVMSSPFDKNKPYSSLPMHPFLFLAGKDRRGFAENGAGRRKELQTAAVSFLMK